ncbi:DUF6503 family protein [Algibacter sp. L4_22]|uniref:DUF6503 family protein n=1 Tax=Algibacter sp. L4_22 TaxID=2942477 RepID=UPI00201B8D98|nr:DUF6503 family protein [Algibacter sp. L4_22]MCL5130387.1 hypothetical protein [Algibacter sp. L4_22]
MRIHKYILVLACSITFLACNDKKKEIVTSSLQEETAPQVKPASKAEVILNQAIEAHGGDLYNSANYSFAFRDNTYHFKNDNQNYEYTKISKKDNNITIDVLKNGKLYRTVNGDTVSLNEKQIKGATGGINSVIYFATLPHKLNDASVNKTYIGDITIKGKNYAVLGITFNQEGGGEDFDDQYRYWINTETKKIDYLAYNYSVNNGGVRFRAAYNKRVLDGITFQDYTNYEAEVGTPLDQLPELFEAGKLKELSKIKTEDIINLSTK